MSAAAIGVRGDLARGCPTMKISTPTARADPRAVTLNALPLLPFFYSVCSMQTRRCGKEIFRVTKIGLERTSVRRCEPVSRLC